MRAQGLKRRVLLEPEEEEEDYTEVIKSSIECYCNHRLCPSPVLEDVLVANDVKWTIIANQIHNKHNLPIHQQQQH